MGRPSKYNSKYHVPWARSLAMEGLIDDEIADRMGIVRSTLALWKKKHPEFEEAISRGKEPADAEVEMSLYKRATGFKLKEKRVIVTMDRDGNQMPARIETLEKDIPPDVVACIFWLKNRRPDKWRDKQIMDVENDKEIKFIIQKASEGLKHQEESNKGD